MGRPTARVLALLEILQSGGTHAVADLARRLEVDERTVRRYVEHLLDLAVPVESVRGRYGGYRLGRGFRMPPLMLTDEEAAAVLLGLVTSRRAGTTVASAAAIGSAAAKVLRVLPGPLARRLDALLGSTDFTAPERELPTPTAPVALRLAEAARDHRPVRLRYRDRANRDSIRTVHPYGLVAHSGRWYLTGADTASATVKTFRLDRIGGVDLEEGTFTAPEEFESTEEVLASLARTPWRHEVSVLVRGDADEVRARLPQGVALVEPGDTSGQAGGDGWVSVQMRVERLDWLPGVLAGLELPFLVQRPDELRAFLRAWANRVAGCADATSDQEVLAAWDRSRVPGDVGRI